jgi:hypothetical protein
MGLYGGFSETHLYLVITVRLRKINCSPYKFKKTVLPKSGRSGGTFGPKFPVFLLVYYSLYVTPIRQQNPPGPLKLLGLRGKNRQKCRFLILLKKTDFLDAHFVTSCGGARRALTPLRCKHLTVRLQHASRDVIFNFIFAARTARREKGPR